MHKKVWEFEDKYHSEMESDPLVDIDALPGLWDDYDEENDNIPV